MTAAKYVCNDYNLQKNDDTEAIMSADVCKDDKINQRATSGV